MKDLFLAICLEGGVFGHSVCDEEGMSNIEHVLSVRNPTRLPEFLLLADMSFEPVGNLGSLRDGERPYIGNEGVFKRLTLVFEPLLGRYEFA